MRSKWIFALAVVCLLLSSGAVYSCGYGFDCTGVGELSEGGCDSGVFNFSSCGGSFEAGAYSPNSGSFKLGSLSLPLQSSIVKGWHIAYVRAYMSKKPTSPPVGESFTLATGTPKLPNQLAFSFDPSGSWLFSSGNYGQIGDHTAYDHAGTFSQHACYLCSICNVSHAQGNDTNPAGLNSGLLAAIDGYLRGGLINSIRAAAICGLRYLGAVSTNKAMALGYYDILNVRKGRHFVTATCWDLLAKCWRIADPARRGSKMGVDCYTTGGISGTRCFSWIPQRPQQKAVITAISSSIPADVDVPTPDPPSDLGVSYVLFNCNYLDTVELTINGAPSEVSVWRSIWDDESLDEPPDEDIPAIDRKVAEVISAPAGIYHLHATGAPGSHYEIEVLRYDCWGAILQHDVVEGDFDSTGVKDITIDHKPGLNLNNLSDIRQLSAGAKVVIPSITSTVAYAGNPETTGFFIQNCNYGNNTGCFVKWPMAGLTAQYEWSDITLTGIVRIDALGDRYIEAGSVTGLGYYWQGVNNTFFPITASLLTAKSTTPLAVAGLYTKVIGKITEVGNDYAILSDGNTSLRLINISPAITFGLGKMYCVTGIPRRDGTFIVETPIVYPEIHPVSIIIKEIPLVEPPEE